MSGARKCRSAASKSAPALAADKPASHKRALRSRMTSSASAVRRRPVVRDSEEEEQDDDDDDEDPSDREERLFLAHVNSITGETNAQVQEARRYNSHHVTSQQVVEKLRALHLVANRKVKPISQWSAQQKSAIVKLIRGRLAIASGRPSYADESSFMLDYNLTNELLDAFSTECDLDPDMLVQME